MRGEYSEPITLDDPNGLVDDAIAWQHTASPEAVAYVLAQPVGTGDGRSEWVWLRLANGDLILGVWPQGDTYEMVSCGDGEYRHTPPIETEREALAREARQEALLDAGEILADYRRAKGE